MKDLKHLATRLMELDDRLAACMKCGNCQAVCPMFGATHMEGDVARGKIVLIEIGQSVNSIGQNAFHGYTFVDAGGNALNADASSLAGHLFQGSGKVLRLEA